MAYSRVISMDGVALYAKDFDMYSVIVGTDGIDYIIEEIENKKQWVIYNNNQEEVENNIVIGPPPPDMVPDLPLKGKKIINLESVKEKKKLVKISTSEQKPEQKTKKISEYHSFIRDFLSSHQDIPYKERMKSANVAYKEYKLSKGE